MSNRRNDKQIKLLGKRYSLKRPVYLKKNWGDCDAPTAPRKAIRVIRGLQGKKELDTLIHEMLHACDWEKSEKWVSNTATDIARVLYSLGYRKVEKRK